MTQLPCAVIGAGAAGLIAAQELQAAGRDVRGIELLPVTKFFPAADVIRLIGLGERIFGESREPEAGRKVAEVRAEIVRDIDQDRAGAAHQLDMHPGVDETARDIGLELGLRQVAPVGLGAGGQEERVVAPPDRQQRRPLRPEVVLKLRVERHVRAVIEDQVELDLLGPGPTHE